MHKKIKNIFLNEEIQYLKNIIKKKENLNLYTVRSDTGRIFIDINDIDKKIIKKVEKIITDIYNKKYKVREVAFHRYSLEYGTPNLKPHTDDLKCEVVFDYQIDANKKWDVVVNGESINLKNNDAVVFEGESDAHWRKITTFTHGQYVSMIAFLATTDSHWSNFTDVDPIKSEQRQKIQKYIYEKWKKQYIGD